MRKSIFLLLFVCFLGISSSCFAQQGKEAASASSPEGRMVSAIEVKGNKSISTNIIISKMKTRIGSPYQENVVSDDLKRLYLLGFFNDANIDTQDFKDGVKVIVTVTERPIIRKITFTGITRVTMKDEKLKAQLKSKESQYLDYPNLTEDVHTLKKMYEKIGFGQVDINYNVVMDSAANKADVEFAVFEGKKIHIKDIFIKGNKAFSVGRVRKLLKTKRGWLFNAGILKEDVLKEDMERIKAFYRRNGYTDIAVSNEVIKDAKKPYLLYITITVKEGKKYLIGNVIIQGNKDVSEKVVLSKLSTCLPGKVYSEEGVKQDLSNIQGIYFDRGYISSQVQDSIILNSETGRVDVSYAIVENQVTYVDKIKIRGNIKTKDVVIRRELRIRPGEKFDGQKLRRTKERLVNQGYFEDVSYDTEESTVPDKKNLVVDVKESKTGSFSFGGGYSTVDQLVGFIEVEQKNFDWRNWPYFTGGGQNLKVRASFGSISNYFDLSFTEPCLFDYPVAGGFDLYHRTHDKDEDVGYGYDEKVTGGDIRFGKELTEYIRADITYRLDQINIANIDDDASDDLKQEEGDNTISSITTGLAFDSRDNIFDTRRGDYLSGAAQFAGLGGTKNFLKLTGRASHFFPMPRSAVLEVRAKAGIADPYGDSESIPIYERFFAGGANSVRGYEERRVGPIDSKSDDPLGGEAMAVVNFEYTYPFFNFLRGAIFYDVGQVWSKMDEFGTGGYMSSYGIGVRIKTPLGPISLDYGFPLDKVAGEEDIGGGRLHFSASHGF